MPYFLNGYTWPPFIFMVVITGQSPIHYLINTTDFLLSWKNRLVGLQYVNTREPKTEPMSYRILGYFLLSQIALESYPTLINLARTLMKTWGVTYDPPGTDQNTQEAGRCFLPFHISLNQSIHTSFGCSIHWFGIRKRSQ